MAAGGVLKLFLAFGLFAVIMIAVFTFRAFAGWYSQLFLNSIGLNPSTAFTPEEQQFLSTIDIILHVLPWAGLVVIALAIAAEIYGRTTEGYQQQYY